MTEKTKTKAWGGAFAAYGQIYKQVRKNPAPALAFIGVYLVLAIISAIFQDGKSYMNNHYNTYEDIVYIIFLLALPVYGLALADGKTITVREFLRFDFKKFVFLIAAGLLYILIIGFSLLLLIIPAVWTIAWFFVSNYAVVDKNMGPIQALKESKRLAENHKAKVWGVIGVTILLSIPAIFLAWIPYIGIIGYGFMTVLGTGVGALLYRWLQHNHSAKTIV